MDIQFNQIICYWDSVAISSNLLPTEGYLKLHKLVLFPKEIKWMHVPQAHSILLCSCVFPRYREGQMPQSTYNMGLCAPETVQQAHWSNCQCTLFCVRIRSTSRGSQLQGSQETTFAFVIFVEPSWLCISSAQDLPYSLQFCAVATRKVLTNCSVQTKVMQIIRRAAGNKFRELIR